MSTEIDLRDYVNPHPRFSAKAQRDAFAALPGTLYAEDKSGKVIDVLIQSVRRGSIVRVLRPFLLAPTRGSTKKRRDKWADRAERIKKAGGMVVATDAPHLSGPRLALLAYEEIASSGRGRSGTSRSGRPPLEIPAERLQAMTAIWCSRQYKTRREAAAALREAGYAVTVPWCYRHLGMPNAPKFKVQAAPEPIKPRRKKRCFVYFIREGQMVKIGSSTDPATRLRDMSVANGGKLEMLATMPGDRKRERALHKKFHKHHIRGEWFHLAAPILKYIAAYKPKRRKR